MLLLIILVNQKAYNLAIFWKELRLIRSMTRLAGIKFDNFHVTFGKFRLHRSQDISKKAKGFIFQLISKEYLFFKFIT